MERLCALSIPDIHLLLKRGDIRVQTLLDEAYERIEQNSLNIFVTLFKEDSYKRAKEIQGRIKRENDIDILTGIPIAVKDNICVEGHNTTCGSKMLHNFVSPYSATVVKRLEDRGAIIIGKTNPDEFAMGSSTETSFYAPTKNPHNNEYVPGGSSGGSAAAVAAFEAVSALGSDTGGSIRQPASFCGVFGLKPTYGRVSRYGLVAFASSLDCIGPITHNVGDSAIVMEAIAGFDPMDSTSIPENVARYYRDLNGGAENIKIGVVRGELMDCIDADVRDVMDEFTEGIKSTGIQLEDVDIAGFDFCIPVYYIIATSEASSNLARYDGIRYGYKNPELKARDTNLKEMYEVRRNEGFGKEVKRRIMLGTFSLRTGYKDKYYNKAIKARQKITTYFEEILKRVDAVLLPTSPILPFKIGEKINDPISMYLSDLCTVSVSLAGLPAISIPAGYRKGLPVGVQLVGRRLEEETLLKIAHFLEKTGLTGLNKR
ncbi:Asp-tRNA(Asn)/Glu-tRNA(Gln) amidotransferase GatCAB subunit A [candidate division WOR-3 bacterium JGI_Cruoil_03_44_89]|uniref:Glutamyl-tRNA(Gln) amidotransferase subunit A n=1 Tax=candidate division WOR-3 bacterium JGI_Cruoil_03_44_89 TaxID=1973748 RepID=A0A235BPY0_UNCW3|nr:MAG: Asp-tRNA(Asn)/Glu-tRNA(Gln) amidotransferase GatCAB subunit A [candidate division WOR-3 bacterium JGI_Cruoil_03_44_89]